MKRQSTMKTTKCWICNGEFSDKDDDYKKVRDHCHFTGKFRGAAHNKCNLKYKKPKFTPVVFHNLSGYDSHLFIKNLGVSEGNINCIPNNEEKYISFSKDVVVGSYKDKKTGKEKQIKHQLRFIDSCKFMPSSLERLVENMDPVDFKVTRKVLGLGERMPPLNGEGNRLCERIDRDKLEYIVNHPEEFNIGRRSINGVDVNYLDLLKGYLCRCNHHGEQDMSYSQRGGRGRMFADEKLSMQSMCRKVRHTICKGRMIDIDMVNAHPTLLSEYCHQMGIPCEGLDAYVNDRERYLKKWKKSFGSTRAGAKMGFLAIMNGRTYDVNKNYPSWFLTYYNCIRSIMNSIGQLDENRALIDDIIEKKGTENLGGKVINAILCNLENSALMAVHNYLAREGFEVGAWVFDGLMVYKKRGMDVGRLLKGCGAAVDQELGYKISFAVKEMDEGYDIHVKSGLSVSEDKLDLLLRKGSYPYEYMDSIKRLGETQLPPKEAFYSRLNGEEISDG